MGDSAVINSPGYACHGFALSYLKRRTMAPINNTESAEERHREPVIHFLADLLRVTVDIKDPEAFQSALQTFCDDLCPWLEHTDCPPNPRAVFSLLEDCTF